MVKGKKIKKSTTKKVSTKVKPTKHSFDPRAMKLLTNIICAVLLISGTILAFTKYNILGAVIIVLTFIVYLSLRRDYVRLVREYEAKHKCNIDDSDDAMDEYKRETIKNIKDAIEETTNETFTKENYEWFISTSLPLYFLVALVITIISFIVGGLSLGLLVIIFFILSAIVYYYIVTKILKK